MSCDARNDAMLIWSRAEILAESLRQDIEEYQSAACRQFHYFPHN
jgi:hypothetical protein